LKLELFVEETNNVWSRVTGKPTADDLQVQLDLYKKLLNFFQVGDYYYFIFNLQTHEFDFVSKEVETLLDYQPQQVTIPLFFEIMHPDDRPWFLAFEEKTAGFLTGLPLEKLMKYKVRYDFRIKKNNGSYIRVLHQVAVIQHDQNGGILRTLGVHTDISHLKFDGKPVLSYIGMDGEPSYLNIDIKNNYLESKEPLTRREKDVLRHLIEGKLSKEICDILHISKQTVDSHRKNMLRKNNLNNSSELIAKAIRKGWI
jgi:DNA-binding CsgD family transcriptional regulator